MKTIYRMKILSRAFLATALVLLACNAVRAQSIYVPNAYFSLPVVTDPLTDVATNMISWGTFPPDADGEIGVFGNLPILTNVGEYIFNCDGPQAAYMFDDPTIALFEDYDAVDSTGTPSHTFTATYQVGQSYQLQAGFIASVNSLGLLPGSIITMSLYYRDDTGDMQTVASTDVLFDTNVFTGETNFVQFEVSIPAAQSSDPWAGRHIGIEFAPQFTDPAQQGFWDIGNVQLWNIPCLLNPTLSNGQFGATLLSQPGQIFQILATTNLALPLSNWTSVVTVTNTSGTASFVDPTPSPHQRFYQAEQVLPPPPS
jgi:hypothetical protein